MRRTILSQLPKSIYKNVFKRPVPVIVKGTCLDRYHQPITAWSAASLLNNQRSKIEKQASSVALSDTHIFNQQTMQ